MPSNTQKAIRMIFLATTLISTVFIAYTTHVYVIVFRGVRSFGVATPWFNVKVVNSSYILTTTNLTIQNPSELTFELRLIREMLSINGEFIVSQTQSIPGYMHIAPNSVVMLTVEAEIPSHRISYVTAHLDEVWVVYIRIYLNAPLVNGFSWANSWVITEASEIQMNVYGGYII